MPQTFKPPKCKSCKIDTEMIGSWADGDKDLALYQCPKCKTVVMKVLSLF
jgi:hypothetical protein